MKKHLTSIITACVIVIILITYMVTFTVSWKEKALVISFGRIVRQENTMGLKWQWPWNKVIKFDGRIRTLTQTPTELQTADQQTIIASVYINWRISDARIFYERFRQEGSTSSADIVAQAEKTLKTWISESANIFAEYNLSELVTVDKNKFKMAVLEKGTPAQPGGMLLRLRQKAKTQGGYGIEIIDLGIRKLGIPEKVSEQVFNRMREDRNAEVRRLQSEGQSLADSIVGKAKSQATQIKAKAQADAKNIMGLADAEAAGYYTSFVKNPKLANYLRELDTLRKTLNKRSTIVLDSKTAPYNLLQSKPSLEVEKKQ